MLERRQRFLIKSNRTRAHFQNGVESVFSSKVGDNCSSKGSTEKYAFYVLSFEARLLTLSCFLMVKIPNEIGKIALKVKQTCSYYRKVSSIKA